MYSAKNIQATLDSFRANEGWTPKPHTIDEVDEFKSYINSIVKIESNSKSSWIESVRPLTARREKELSRWIENEQAMCAINSGYFETRYAYLQDECGTISKFKNRKSQEVLDSVIADLEDLGAGIELLILGTRQSGIGTKILLKILHKMLFIPNTQALVASVIHEKSDRMAAILDIVYDQLPWWLPPLKTPKRSFNNSSKLLIRSGMQTSNVASGFTPSCMYLSDADRFPTPMKTIEDGILRAIHSSRNSFCVLHGVKGSESGWLANIYRYAKEYWPQGKFRFCPIFVPWAICSDIYPHRDWLRKYPISKAWKPIVETLEHKEKCGAFIRNTPYLANIAGNDWSMSREQQWFWEFEYLEAKRRHTLDRFEKNFAPDDGEVVAEETSAGIDYDALFPSPTAMQERIVAARQRLLEG